MLIYKILLPAEWDAFDADGRFAGSPFDVESGFIHLSSRDQVAATARRFFADVAELVIVAIDDDAVAETLRWETSANHGDFPHVYGSLPRSAVVKVYRAYGAGGVETALTGQ